MLSRGLDGLFLLSWKALYVTHVEYKRPCRGWLELYMGTWYRPIVGRVMLVATGCDSACLCHAGR